MSDMESQSEDVPAPDPVDTPVQAVEQPVEASPAEDPAAPAEDFLTPAEASPAEDPTAPTEDFLTPAEVEEHAQEDVQGVVDEAAAPDNNNPPEDTETCAQRPKPIGPLYAEHRMYPEHQMYPEPQMYPSVPPPYHDCETVYKSTYSNMYKSCSTATIDSIAPALAPAPARAMYPHPPVPPPTAPPQPQEEAEHVRKLLLPNFFGEILEDDVTFCIDTSGSMYYVLDTVKDHLIEVLAQRAQQQQQQQREMSFNLIDFSTEITQWSNKMVKCSPQTVGVATRWIKKMAPKTGTNTLNALLSAFRDPKCQAVVLVTDGLSDQHPQDILDGIHFAADNRPVHAYYIQGDRTDDAAIDFLRDVAMETYGSFHIINVSTLGAIEAVTPVYRASCAAERPVRVVATSGERLVYPANHRVVKTAHTVHHPHPHPHPHTHPHTPIVALAGPPPFVHPSDPFWPYLQHPYYLYPWPYRHFFQHYSPTVGWSRYRPARAFLQETKLLMDAADTLPVVPGPGAMLLGQKVLARKHTDGFFYLGSVKSQVLDNKFLVAFGPSTHGAFRDTSYGETFVYDIVSHVDALRHAVVCGDRVLAPWQPDGDRFGPGEVIEGQEARSTDGYRDQQLVVHFFNGETVKLPAGTAVWIPQQLHERITFELKLPSKVRLEFQEQSMYPAEQAIPGYPTSGVRADPVEYESYAPAWIPGERPVQVPAAPAVRSFYRYPYPMPRQPAYYAYDPRTAMHDARDAQEEPYAAAAAVDDGAAIPGTGLTKSQLNEKVVSQILMNTTGAPADEEKLLKKRETMGDNTILKKSVSFDRRADKPLTDLEAEYDAGELDFGDSGRGSMAEDDDVWLSDVEGGETETRDAAVGTDDRLLQRRQRTKSRQGKRPPWKYWSGDPAPDLIEPMHLGPYRVGPYEPWLEPLPLERRCLQRGEFGGEWSQSQFVDPQAQTAFNEPSVKDSMQQWPRPPPPRRDKQGPGEEVGEALGKHMAEQECRFQQRTQFRRTHAMEREARVDVSRDDEYLGQKMMSDQHHQRILAQLEHQRSRQLNDIAKVERQREAKKSVNVEVRTRITEYQQREQEREGQRYDRMRATREQREAAAQSKQQEHQQLMQNRQVTQQQRAEDREVAFAARVVEQEASMSAADVRARNAKLQRREHFRTLEADGQRRRTLEAGVRSQQEGILRSQVLPTADTVPVACGCGAPI